MEPNRHRRFLLAEIHEYCNTETQDTYPPEYAIREVWTQYGSLNVIPLLPARYSTTTRPYDSENDYQRFDPDQIIDSVPQVLHPAAAEVMDSLVDTVVEEQLTSDPVQHCTICLEEYSANDTVNILPDCNHKFHAVCIKQWLEMHGTCPMCRQSFRTKPTVNQSDLVAEMLDIISEQEQRNAGALSPADELDADQIMEQIRLEVERFHEAIEDIDASNEEIEMLERSRALLNRVNPANIEEGREEGEGIWNFHPVRPFLLEVDDESLRPWSPGYVDVEEEEEALLNGDNVIPPVEIYDESIPPWLVPLPPAWETEQEEALLNGDNVVPRVEIYDEVIGQFSPTLEMEEEEEEPRLNAVIPRVEMRAGCVRSVLDTHWDIQRFAVNSQSSLYALHQCVVPAFTTAYYYIPFSSDDHSERPQRFQPYYRRHIDEPVRFLLQLRQAEVFFLSRSLDHLNIN